MSRVDAMRYGADLPAAAPPPPGDAAAGEDASAAPIAARRPGAALRQLEAAAQAELQRLLAQRQAQVSAVAAPDLADPVWAGLAWDLGLSGGAIAAAGTSQPWPAHPRALCDD